MSSERAPVRVLAAADVSIHGLAVAGALLAFATAPLVHWPHLAARAGLGLAPVALVHALGGWGAAAALLLHGVRVCLAWLSGGNPVGLLPRRSDVQDLGEALRFALGLRPVPPSWGRYSYREKVPYLTFLAGGLVAVLTGFGAAHPVAVAASLGTGAFMALAQAHAAVGVLLLPFLLWHLYFAHLQPGVLSWNPAWITGKAPAEQVERTKPAWYRLLTEEPVVQPQETEAEKAASVEQCLAAGNQAAREGRYGEAERAYLDALTLYPGYSQALFNLGVVRRRAGSGPGAKEALSRFLENDPFNPLAEKAQEMIREIEAEDDLAK